jgi:hypothetical protein
MLEISLDGKPGIEAELQSSSRRLRERYYIGGRKDFGKIVVSPTGQPFIADTDRMFDSLRLLRYTE